MASEDLQYYQRRAQQEREKAEALPPGDPAEIAHRQMAEQYERRAQRPDQSIYQIVRSQAG
jgi:hypothetical protein